MSGAPSAPSAWAQPQEAVQPSPSSSSGEGSMRRSPSSSIFGAARGIASTALHVAQMALEGDNGAEGGARSENQPKSHPLQDLFETIKSGTLATDAITMINLATQASKPIDDRKMLLEQILVLLYTLPPQAPIGDVLQNSFIKLLWSDLQHPPLSFVGKARYRSADGSGNNFFNPRLGAAGEPYARSVAPVHCMPQQLPDLGTVFDALLKRDKFVPHPSGVSSLLFAFATCITHSVFNTNRADPSINDASSYLDLSPVYGNNEKDQQTVRTFEQGRIYPDVVASQRLFLMPPGTVALLIVFSRNHNWIVDKLLEINQNGQFQPVESLDDVGKKKQDEDLFQVARLVNCGWFLQVVFQDYIRVILNVNRTDSTWSLVPTNEIKSVVGGEVPRGTGNAVSVEFDILYRWHAAMSQKDTVWIEELMKRYSQTPFEEMTEKDFKDIYQGLSREMGNDPRKWAFGGIVRTGPDKRGPFRDSDLVRIISEATEEIAGAFKARGVPVAMRIIDVLGMQVARKDWACASLNEFRKFLNLTTYTTFEQWNPDPVITNAARELYHDIANLELMPGLAAEQPKPSQQASGLAPGYTISRAILSDAAALVRGDRYFTTDFNAGNLTSFLYEDLQPDLEGGAFGGVVGKLLMRHFPNFYTYNSTYALFPFATPSTTTKILADLGVNDQYDARRPTAAPEWVLIRTRQAAETVLEDKQTYHSVYGPHIAALEKGQPSLLSFFTALNKPKAYESVQDVLDIAFFPHHFANLIVAEVGEMTKQQLKEKSWSHKPGEMKVDIVARVIISTCMTYIAEQVGFPLKTRENPRGLLTEVELYNALCQAYTFVYLNFDPSQGFRLRDQATEKTKVLRAVIEFRIAQAQGTSATLHTIAQDIKTALLGKSSQGLLMPDRARKMYDALLNKTNRPIDELANVIQLAMIQFVTTVHSAAKVINFYLKPENSPFLRDLQKQASAQVGVANDANILRYVDEALRIDPAVCGIARRATSKASLNQVGPVQEGQLVYIDLTSVNLDPVAFPHPREVKLDRNPELYKLAERGVCSGGDESLNITVVLAIAKEVFRLRGLRRAPGDAGQLGAYKGAMLGPVKTMTAYVLPDQTLTPFPQSMVVDYKQ
ncbi:hypothetical protein JCM21900_002592 [Sporobolomyces salmonicolor]